MYESCKEPVIGIDNSDEEELYHYGTKHEGSVPHSGRYPWGSGDKSFQRPKDFYSFVENLKNKGASVKDIAATLGLSMTEFEDYYKESYIDNYRPQILKRAISNKSGVYPWGKDKQFKNPWDFYNYVKNEKKTLKEKQIIEKLNMSANEYRSFYSMALSITDREKDYEIKKLSNTVDPDTGKLYTNEKIGAIVGNKYDNKPIRESTIRAINRNSGRESKQNASINTAIILMKTVDEVGPIDVSKATGPSLGITDDKMKEALKICEAEGYYVHNGRMPMAGQKGKTINTSVLHKGGPNDQKVAYDFANIHSAINYVSTDNGRTFKDKTAYPKAMNKDRIQIRYAEDGGKDKDGLIEIREGVKDLTMGDKRYCQARILVDNGGGEKDLYLKGMAVYSNGKDMPKGIDIIFNTNKPKGTPKEEVLKSVKDNLLKDKTNPFGATIKLINGQTWYPDPNGDHTDPITGEKISLSLVNKTTEEGDWDTWSKNLPSQFLSKQPLRLIKKQINETISKKEDEFNEISNLTNYAIKAKMLQDFADQCDTDAMDLQTSSFDGTHYHVLLPSKTLKPNEIYAPNYPDGSQLALVRFPHGGTFEIPILTVNNNNKECKEMIGTNPSDAICVPHSAASQLSGADFDGDTALVIPTRTKGVIIQNSPRLIEEDWDPGIYGPDIDGVRKDNKGNFHYYRNGKEYKHISEDMKQKQMGIVSNLITDMTIQGAPRNELARAVKHSMVVIDSYKHDLDYRQSEIDNGITELKQRYQKKPDDRYGGATTILSRAKSPIKAPERAEGAFVLNIEGHPDFGNKLTMIDPVKHIYLDEKTGKKYGLQDKKNLLVDPKTGEKLYHETMKMHYKIGIIDSKTGKEKLSNIYIKNPGFNPDNKKEYIKPEYDLKFYDIKKEDSLFYFDQNTKQMIPVSQTDKRIKKPELDMKDYPQMSLISDAHEITSMVEYPQERYYADYANKLKALANEARKEAIYADNHRTPYSSEAREKYIDEYRSLRQKCDEAILNIPKEREAQRITNAIIAQQEKEQSIPWSKDQRNRHLQSQLFLAREMVGAHSSKFEITDKEWEAIQAGAISDNMLKNEILRFADSERIKQLATPKVNKELSSAQIAKIKGFAAKGETNSSIARRLGISSSTVSKYLNGGK